MAASAFPIEEGSWWIGRREAADRDWFQPLSSSPLPIFGLFPFSSFDPPIEMFPKVSVSVLCQALLASILIIVYQYHHLCLTLSCSFTHSGHHWGDTPVSPGFKPPLLSFFFFSFPYMYRTVICNWDQTSFCLSPGLSTVLSSHQLHLSPFLPGAWSLVSSLIPSFPCLPRTPPSKMLPDRKSVV